MQNNSLETSRRLLIIGGKGALGSVLIEHFKSKGCWIVSVDRGDNILADISISLLDHDLKQQVENICI